MFSAGWRRCQAAERLMLKAVLDQCEQGVSWTGLTSVRVISGFYPHLHRAFRMKPNLVREPGAVAKARAVRQRGRAAGWREAFLRRSPLRGRAASRGWEELCAGECFPLGEMLRQGVGPDDPQRSLPTPTTLWFCDFGAALHAVYILLN